ncbi:MAG: tRNA lysidine(34) synthetase TilS [Clostridia bacterium]|nr:tRNA lysidine(34) synthetase TilS [Clostridia bacterium]
MIRPAFLDAVSRYGMDEAMLRAGVVVAGFSGGADSSCLLRLLKDWCDAHSVTLAAAHINHGIRGANADRDEQFCRAVCRELEIPLYVGVYDVPALADDWGMGLEEAARRVRYGYFDEVSRILTGSSHRAVIATAHNATDNAETVLFHLARGTGIHGLCGIDPIRDGRFIRPLITVSGSDIRRWCEEHSIPSVTDETNTDTAYTRNLIRQNILPVLRQIVPSPEASVTRMTALLRQDDDYLTETARSLAGDTASLEREPLAALHPAILSRVLMILHSRTGADSSMSEIHIRQCMELICGNPSDASLDLPGNIRFTMDRHRISFVSADCEKAASPSFEIPFTGEDFENSLYRTVFAWGTSQKFQEKSASLLNKEENIYKLSIHKTLDFDKIIGALKIRNRREGDSIRFGGMTRKVKKLLIDQKLTAEEKACLPILCDDCGIVWIPGFPPRDGMEYKGTGTPLTITVLKKN